MPTNLVVSSRRPSNSDLQQIKKRIKTAPCGALFFGKKEGQVLLSYLKEKSPAVFTLTNGNTDILLLSSFLQGSSIFIHFAVFIDTLICCPFLKTSCTLGMNNRCSGSSNKKRRSSNKDGDCRWLVMDTGQKPIMANRKDDESSIIQTERSKATS